MALQLTVEITQPDENAFAFVLDLIRDQIEDGFTSGFDSSDTGSYSYVLSGEPDDPKGTGS